MPRFLDLPGGNAGGGGNGGDNGGGGDGGGNCSAASLDGDYNDIILAPITPKVALAVFTITIRKRYPANDIAVLDDPH